MSFLDFNTIILCINDENTLLLHSLNKQMKVHKSKQHILRIKQTL